MQLRLDKAALQIAGIDPRQTITLPDSQGSIHAVLDELETRCGLRWTMFGRSLVVTSPDEVWSLCTLRVYGVEDLIAVDRPGAIEALARRSG